MHKDLKNATPPAHAKSARSMRAAVVTIAALLCTAPASAQFLEDDLISPGRIARWLVRQGFVEVSRPHLAGEVYVVEGVDQGGHRVRFVVDAFDGEVLQSQIVGVEPESGMELAPSEAPRRRQRQAMRVAPKEQPRLPPVRPRQAQPETPSMSPSAPTEPPALAQGSTRTEQARTEALGPTPPAGIDVPLPPVPDVLEAPPHDLTGSRAGTTAQ